MPSEDPIREIAIRVCNEVLREKSRELADDIAKRMGAALASQPPQPSRGKELRDGAILISGCRTQTEILEALLAASSSITPACGLMILRGGHAGGWSCIGLTALDNFKRATLDCTRGIVARVISSGSATAAKVSEIDPAFVTRLGLASEARILLVPVLLKARVAALLVAPSHQADDLVELELLVQVAQLSLDLLAYRKLPPQPAAAPQHAAPRVAAPEPPPAYVPPVETRVVAVAPPVRAPEPPPVYVPPVHTPPAETRIIAVAPPVAVPEPPPVYVPPTPAQAEVVPAAASEPTVALAAFHGDVAPPVAELGPPPVYVEPARAPVAVLPAPDSEAAVALQGFHGSVSPPEQAPVVDEAHEKARRFAKLLVEEIKLYNQGKVAEGRAQGDLYIRLREDIEKSRAAYQNRFGQSVAEVDYFNRELLRILADNNPAMMGVGFPA